MFQNQSFPKANPDIVAGGYTQLPQKFYHPNAGRNALGIVGGNDVSLITGNLVDLESDLRGITRDLSKAPAKQYHSTCNLGGDASCQPKQLVFQERSTGRSVTVNTVPRHLPTLQMFSFPGVPKPDPFIQEVYGAPWRF